jgi:uncharacterized protein (TIGR02996 family)
VSSPKTATDLLAQERWAEALVALLDAWRSVRAPELERVIVTLSDTLAAGVEPIDPEQSDWQQQWDLRAKRRHAAELASLLPHATRLPKNMIPRRVRALLEYDGDPRIGARLVEIIEAPPLTASSNFSMWSELFAALPKHADARVQARLEARAATRGGKSQFWTKLEKWIAAVVRKLPEPASLPAEWAAALPELERRLAALAKRPALTLSAEPEPEPDAPTPGEGANLASVRAAIEANELAAALDQLVHVWAQQRNPSVAALIERLGLLVDETAPAPSGKPKALHAAWMSAAERPRPSAIGPLLASLRDGKLADVEARIEAMLDWTPDPRVAAAMITLSKDYMLGARDRLWRAVYDVLVDHADPRVADYLRSRHDRLSGPQILHRPRVEGRELLRVFEAFEAAVAAPTDLTRDRWEQVEAIERALAERLEAKLDEARRDAELERGLVEAIVADWDADEPRLIYADWLQAREDPRGEFIALDVALARGKSVKGAREKYYKAHEAALFGPLASVAGWRHGFERGLLVKLQVHTRKGGLDVPEDRRRAIVSDLRWATIRELEVSHDEDVAELFERLPLLSLRRLGRPNLPAMLGFARRRDAIPLAALSLSAREGDSDESWAAFGELTRVLPKLESLAIMIWGREGGRVTPPLACFRGELVRRASALINGDANIGGLGRLDEWITRMVESECPVPRVQIVGPTSAQARQIEPGRFEVELSLDRLRRLDDDVTQETLACLRGLPRPRIAGVHLTTRDVADEVRPELDAALAGLPVR